MNKKASKQSEITEMKNDFEILGNIKKVEVSPFLITRINQKIENQIQFISSKLAYSLGFSFLLILFINVFVLINNFKTQKVENNLAKSMHLFPENTLYK